MTTPTTSIYRRDAVIGVILILIAAVLPFVFPTRYVVGQMTIFFIWATVVSQWNLVFGVAGIFSVSYTHLTLPTNREV